MKKFNLKNQQMKTILVPTDFSETSHNAIEYAVEIAKLTKAKIILFNVFHIPYVTTEVPVMVITPINEIENECLKKLKKMQKSIYLKYGDNLNVEYECKCGFVLEEINQYTKENKIDLIVIGMQGAGYLSEKIIGSITTSLMNNAKCPVLAIDKKVKFRSIKRIVLAYDYSETKEKSVFEPLKELVKVFKSHVSVLNIVRELEELVTVTKAVAGIKLKRSLENIGHTFHYSKNEDVVDGINEFVTEQDMDLVVMIPHRHSTFKNLFHEPQTQKMAFHTSVPLLALHD